MWILTIIFLALIIVLVYFLDIIMKMQQDVASIKKHLAVADPPTTDNKK